MDLRDSRAKAVNFEKKRDRESERLKRVNHDGQLLLLLSSWSKGNKAKRPWSFCDRTQIFLKTKSSGPKSFWARRWAKPKNSNGDLSKSTIIFLNLNSPIALHCLFEFPHCMSGGEFGVRLWLWLGGSRTWKVASELGYDRVLVPEFESELFGIQNRNDTIFLEDWIWWLCEILNKSSLDICSDRGILPLLREGTQSGHTLLIQIWAYNMIYVNKQSEG